MPRDIHAFTCEIPKSLHGELLRVSKALGQTKAYLVREAVREKVDTLLAYLDARKKRKNEEREEESQRRKAKFGGQTLNEEPISPTTPSDTIEETDSQFLDPPDELYLQHAERILAVAGDPIERQIAVGEAIRDIRKKRALTTPDDKEVRERLRKIIARLQEKISAEQQPSATKPVPIEEPPKQPSLIERVLGGIAKPPEYTPASQLKRREEP